MSNEVAVLTDVGVVSVARLFDTTDWSATALGPVGTWPDALRLPVAICMGSGFPMAIWWGPDEVQIYNDAFAPVLGDRHPSGFGQPARDCWPEAWDEIGPILSRIERRA